MGGLPTPRPRNTALNRPGDQLLPHHRQHRNKSVSGAFISQLTTSKAEATGSSTFPEKALLYLPRSALEGTLIGESTLRGHGLGAPRISNLFPEVPGSLSQWSQRSLSFKRWELHGC